MNPEIEVSSMSEGERGYTVPWSVDPGTGVCRRDTVCTIPEGTSHVEVEKRGSTVVATPAGRAAVERYVEEMRAKRLRCDDMAEGEVGYVPHWQVEPDGSYVHEEVRRACRGTSTIEVVRRGSMVVVSEAGRRALAEETGDEAWLARPPPSEERYLVRQIVLHDRPALHAAASAADLRLLARVTAEGRFSGCQNYGQWGVPSWMQEKLEAFIREAEKRSGLGFLRLVVEARALTGVPWEAIIDRSWVPLQNCEVDVGYEPPAVFRDTVVRLRDDAWAKSHRPSPRPRLPPETPSAVRWQRYTEALRAGEARVGWCFPARLGAEARAGFVQSFHESSPELRARVLEDLARTRRPYWRRLRTRLQPA